MSIITIVGAGVMGSAMSFPARDNGHEVRLAGTPLDREIIENCRKNGWHIKLKRRLPDGIKYFQFDEFENAVRDADLLICGIAVSASNGSSMKCLRSFWQPSRAVCDKRHVRYAGRRAHKLSSTIKPAAAGGCR